MSRSARWIAVATAALAGALTAPAGGAAVAAPIIFPAGGWTEPLDAAWLPGGELVALSYDAPHLQRVDLQGRARRMRIGDDVSEYDPHSLVASRDGVVYFSERGRVLRRAPDGSITTVAGRLRRARASGDGGPAVGAGMTPAGLALLPNGSLLIADKRNHRVRRVDPAGRIDTVAGTGRPSTGGDGGRAAAADLHAPFALAASPDGSYLVAHGTRRARVRRVDAEGHITTVAGGGARPLQEACTSPSLPARSVRIGKGGFHHVAALPGGSFAISAGAGLFRIGPDGRLRPVTCDGGYENAPPSE